MALSDVQIRNAKPREKRYKLFDADGLFLEVYPNGSRYWRLKYRVNGVAGRKEKKLSIGVYPEVSLAEARQDAKSAREVLREGGDPSAQKKATKVAEKVSAAQTFHALAEEWIESQAGKWRPSYREKVEAILRANLYPRIGGKPIREVTAQTLLEAIRPIEARGAYEVAGRAREWASRVFRYAIVHGKAEVDHAAALRGAFKVRRPTHYPALGPGEIGDFLRALSEYTGRPETRIAVQLLAHTAVRTIELRAANWAEIDQDEGIWRIPGDRMKSGSDHLVPLSTQALVLLEELRIFTGYSPYLFPGQGRAPHVSEALINQVIARLGYKGRLVGHGFRSMFSTAANESGHFSADAIERQLAHAPKDEVRAAYHRGQHLPERRRLMQWWSDRLDTAQRGGTVVQFQRKEA